MTLLCLAKQWICFFLLFPILFPSFYLAKFWTQEGKKTMWGKISNKLWWSLEFVMRIKLPRFWQLLSPSYIPMMPRVVKQQKAFYPEELGWIYLLYQAIWKNEHPTRNMGKENKSKTHKRETHKIKKMEVIKMIW